MKTRNLLVMTLVLGAMTVASPVRGQTSRDILSARIRSHIHSSTALAGSVQQSGGEELGSSESGFGPLYAPYGVGDLWLDVPVITNDIVYLTLHNTQSNMYCQLLTNLDLRFPKDWGYGQIVHATNDTTLFAPEPMFGRDKTFYRAVEGFPIVSFGGTQDAIEPTNAFSGQSGFFSVFLSDKASNDVTIVYKISGSAENGVDYSNISDSVTILGGQDQAIINIVPIQDDLIEFDEFVTLTLILTNGYVVDPQKYTATIRISDNFGSNVFTVVTDVLGPGGIDYSPAAKSLLVSLNNTRFNHGEPFNFERIYTNGVTTNLFVTNWSGIHGMPNKIKLATVKATAAGFTVGDMYFGTSVSGVIGKLSADGTVSNLTFSTLTADGTNIDTLIQGSLYVDDSGSFGGDLIAVTGGTSAFDGGGVWRVNSSGAPTLLTMISNTHLEGVITLTNDVQKWGPFAGKIITGVEASTNEYGLPRPLVYAISTNGTLESFDLGISPEDFDIIKPNQDLYCLDWNGDKITKVSSTLLTNYWGDLLITEEGADVSDSAGRLFIVHRDNSNTNFVVRSLSNQGNWFEHVTFAPINLPSHP